MLEPIITSKFDMNPDFVKLHVIIVLWGFTAVLGKMIDLPALEIVLFRTVIASTCLALVLRGTSRVASRDVIKLVATGSLIGLHWVLFFESAKVASVSVCMVAMATISLWTAILEPLMFRERALQRLDLVFGAIVIGAVAFVFQSELQYSHGFLLGIGSAIVAAVFSIINGVFATRIHHRVIALYEMSGAAVSCAISIPVTSFVHGTEIDLRPSLIEIAWLVVLAVACTVYAYSEYVELLKRLSVFTINFANNLEPVYGMILGAVFFRDYQHLGTRFYVGSVIIVTAVCCYPLMRKRIATG